MFALSAALLGARFRSNDASMIGAGGTEDGCSSNFEVPAGVNMGRRRSRAVLYQLSGHYKPEKIKTKLKLNRVSINRSRKANIGFDSKSHISSILGAEYEKLLFLIEFIAIN